MCAYVWVTIHHLIFIFISPEALEIRMNTSGTQIVASKSHSPTKEQSSIENWWISRLGQEKHGVSQESLVMSESKACLKKKRW